MTRRVIQSGNSRPHEVALGYRYGTDPRAPLERTPALKVDWWHVTVRTLMIGGTLAVSAYSMGWI